MKKNGSVVGFGANGSGQLGNGTTSSVEPLPVDVLGLGNLIAVAAGWNHSLALRADGTVWAGRRPRGRRRGDRRGEPQPRG